MARARNIKPGFFRNELLAELTPHARLLFAGLWTVADREGRLEDRPRRIKADVLPYDDCDVDGLLAELEGAGFVRRYEAGDGRYIEIATFTKHQNPHKNESASTIPAPERSDADSEDAPDEQRSAPAESLKPDPGYLNPESGEREEPTNERTPRSQQLSKSFSVTAEMRRWAAENTGFDEAEIARETEKFRDHFAGAGVTKVDWVATWRNWMRKAVEYRKGRAERLGAKGVGERPWLATPDRHQPFDFFGASERSG